MVNFCYEDFITFFVHFRKGSGIYDNLKEYSLPYPEAIFDISYFRQNPRPFNTWAKEFFPGVKYKPNIAHFFVKLLHDKGKLTRLYTQVM